MQPPTIRDVARRASVSVATVSRVLNGAPVVREPTRQRVLDAIEELGFSPNSAARQLSGGKTFTVGVISPLFTRPAFVERLAGIQTVLDASEYELVLYSIRSREQLEHRLRLLVGQNRVDGLITISVHFDEQAVLVARPALPVLTIDDERIEAYPAIVIDNVAGGVLATEYLLGKGHQYLGFIGDESNATFGFISTERRFEGFKNALMQAGMTPNDTWHRFGPHSREVAYQHASEILSLSERPTAIVAASDTQAFGVLAAARDLGLRVPYDVAVIGFDDIEPASYMNLTTVRANMHMSGKLAARYLLNWLTNGRPPQDQWQTTLPLEVIERKTV